MPRQQIGQAVSTEFALPITARKSRTIGTAYEYDFALPLIALGAAAGVEQVAHEIAALPEVVQTAINVTAHAVVEGIAQLSASTAIPITDPGWDLALAVAIALFMLAAARLAARLPELPRGLF